MSTALWKPVNLTCFKYFVIFVLFFLPSSCDNNLNCFNSNIEQLLAESDSLANVDIIILGRGNKWKLPGMSDTNIKMSNLAKANAFSTLWNPNILYKNDGHILVLFPCANATEFIAETTQVVNFFQLIASSRRTKGKLWTSIFVFEHPHKFQNEMHTANDTLITPLISKLQIDNFIYILYNIFSAHNTQTMLIREIYSIRGNLINQIVASSADHNPMQNLIFSTSRRSHFQRSPVIAIGIDDLDYPLATEFKPNTTELVGGFEVEIYQYFRDALNFTELAIKGTGYVREGPNQTLTGYSTQLNQELGDIAIGAGEFLEYRVKGPDGITYLHPTFHAHVIAFFKQPPASSIRNIFTQTFTLALWISSLAIWGVIVISLKIAVKLVSRNNGASNANDERISKDSVLWAAGAICQQGYYSSPYSTPVKIVFVCGIFTGLISYVAYSAALVSILAVEVVPIQQFKDLLTEKFYIASDSHIPTAKVVVKDLEDTKQIPKLGEGIRNVEIAENLERLFKKRFALVTIPDSFYPVIQQNYSNNFICSTVATKVVSPRPLKSSCFVKRGSALREFLNYKLLQMQERGIKHRLLKEYIYWTSVQCSGSSGSAQLQLGLRDLFTAFAILASGFFMCLSLVLMEKLHSARGKKSKENDKKSIFF